MPGARPAPALTPRRPGAGPLRPATPGSSSCRPLPGAGGEGRRETLLAPTCSPASWWRQHLATLLQLPRARASLIALASLPRCQSAVAVQGHREPTSGVGCARGGRVRVALSARVCARVFPPAMAKRAQESLDIHTGVPLKAGARWRARTSPLFPALSSAVSK